MSAVSLHLEANVTIYLGHGVNQICGKCRNKRKEWNGGGGISAGPKEKEQLKESRRCNQARPAGRDEHDGGKVSTQKKCSESLTGASHLLFRGFIAPPVPTCAGGNRGGSPSRKTAERAKIECVLSGICVRR